MGGLASAHQAGAASADLQEKEGSEMTSAYSFSGGYSDSGTVAAAHDAADLSRAVSCYRYFFPLVSGAMPMCRTVDL